MHARNDRFAKTVAIPRTANNSLVPNRAYAQIPALDRVYEHYYHWIWQTLYLSVEASTDLRHPCVSRHRRHTHLTWRARHVIGNGRICWDMRHSMRELARPTAITRMRMSIEFGQVARRTQCRVRVNPTCADTCEIDDNSCRVQRLS